MNPFPNSEFPWGRGFLDIVFGLAGMLTMLLVLIIFLINPEGKKEEESAKPVGAVTVFMEWPNDARVDMDLWVKGPKDSKPVGYSHKTGEYFNLLRDDLGHQFDASGKNYEHMISRGFEPGEYIINVHWYSNGPGEDSRWLAEGMPVKIIVTVTITTGNTSVNKDVLISDILIKPRQEFNVAIFTLNKSGNLDIDNPPYRDMNKRLKSRARQ